MRWWPRRRRVATATRITATASRAPISSVSAKTATSRIHSGQPSRPISAAGLAVGRPSAPGTNNRLAIAMPALNADSTAATAIACHNTIAARGARNGHVARASRAGTGPTSITARTVKASPDTFPVSLSPRAERHQAALSDDLNSSSSSARRSASASSAPTRSTKYTSAACRPPESAA